MKIISTKIKDKDNWNNFNHYNIIKYSKNTLIYINYNIDKKDHDNNYKNKRNKNKNNNKNNNKINNKLNIIILIILIIMCLKIIMMYIKIIARIINDNYIIKNSFFLFKKYCLINIYLILKSRYSI